MLLATAGCRESRGDLVGAWRTAIQFKSGSLAAVKDLEFLFVFNAGGTLTESSSYDSAPPVPPAYGIWKKTGRGQYEARYVFFMTGAPPAPEDLAKSGWLPTGHGVLREKIVLSEDGSTYRSEISYQVFDRAGKPAQDGGDGEGRGNRIRF
jgi:hypothetical protein